MDANLKTNLGVLLVETIELEIEKHSTAINGNH